MEPFQFFFHVMALSGSPFEFLTGHVDFMPKARDLAFYVLQR